MWEADLNKNSPMRSIISVPIVLQSGIEVRNRDERTVHQGRDVRSAKTVGQAGWPGCLLCSDEETWLRKWKCTERMLFSEELLKSIKKGVMQQLVFNFLLFSWLQRPIWKARSNLERQGSNYAIIMKKSVFCKFVWHACFVLPVVVGESRSVS